MPRDSYSWVKPTMSSVTVCQRSKLTSQQEKKTACYNVWVFFFLTARKKATYDKFGEEGLKEGIPLEACNTGAWSSKYVYHGKPEKTFMQFFGGDNPFAGEKEDLDHQQLRKVQCVFISFFLSTDFQTFDVPPQAGNLQPGVVKTQDPQIERDLHLSLEDLYLGCTKKIKISRRVGGALCDPSTQLAEKK